MKKTAFIYIILFTLLSSGAQKATAQKARLYKNRLGIIAGGGLATYRGELTKEFHDYSPKGNMLIGLNYRLSSQISIRSELNYFKLKGEHVHKNISASFQSHNVELSSTFVFDLIPLKTSFVHRGTYIPYLFAGVAIMSYNSKTNIMANADMVKSGSDFTFAIPFGLGVRIKASKYLDFSIETGLRKTFSDKIDNAWNGAGQLPVSIQDMTIKSINSETQVAFTDQYLFTQVKLIYCPNKFYKKKAKSIKGFSNQELKKIKTLSSAIASSDKLKISR